MFLDKEVIISFLGIVIFIFWHIKMHYHFKFFKSKGKLKSKNYILFLLHPFDSSLYRMIIIAPFVLTIGSGRYLLISKISCYIIYSLFLFIIIISINI